MARSGGRLVLHPVAGSLDDDGLGMMQEAVQYRGGNGAVVVEDARPLLEGLVGGHDQRPALVPQCSQEV